MFIGELFYSDINLINTLKTIFNTNYYFNRQHFEAIKQEKNLAKKNNLRKRKMFLFKEEGFTKRKNF